MKSIIDDENEWDYHVEGDAGEGPVCCESSHAGIKQKVEKLF